MTNAQKIAVITGDVINSSKLNPEQWMSFLRNALSQFGEEPKDWEIYRGDSFQLELAPEKALEAAIFIKATIRQFKQIDVRLAIGIGMKEYHASKVTSSNGTAFINSGQCFERLKKQKLAIKSHSEEFDLTMNLMMNLASLTMNEWTPRSSMIIIKTIENPALNQSDLSQLLNSSQSSISEGLKRAGFDEIKKFMDFYKMNIRTIC